MEGEAAASNPAASTTTNQKNQLTNYGKSRLPNPKFAEELAPRATFTKKAAAEILEFFAELGLQTPRTPSPFPVSASWCW